MQAVKALIAYIPERDNLRPGDFKVTLAQPLQVSPNNVRRRSIAFRAKRRPPGHFRKTGNQFNLFAGVEQTPDAASARDQKPRLPPRATEAITRTLSAPRLAAAATIWSR